MRRQLNAFIEGHINVFVQKRCILLERRYLGVRINDIHIFFTLLRQLFFYFALVVIIAKNSFKLRVFFRLRVNVILVIRLLFGRHSLSDYLLLSFSHTDILLMGSVVTKSSSPTSCLVILIVIISSSPIKVLPQLLVNLLLRFLLFSAFLINNESIFEKGKLRLLFQSCFGSILFDQCVLT